MPSAGPSAPRARSSAAPRAAPGKRAALPAPSPSKPSAKASAGPSELAASCELTHPQSAAEGLPQGMPTDLPPEAQGVLARRCKAQGVKELAVPRGSGWMQRSGRGSFQFDEKQCMQVEGNESNFFLLTYDQTPDSHCVRTGHYQLDVHARCCGASGRAEQPFLCIVFDWQRSLSTITSPCFSAVALYAGGSGGCWRLEQHHEGRQTLVAEVADPPASRSAAPARAYDVKTTARRGAIAKVGASRAGRLRLW